jgi:hypothetical protein
MDALADDAERKQLHCRCRERLDSAGNSEEGQRFLESRFTENSKNPVTEKQFMKKRRYFKAFGKSVA